MKFVKIFFPFISVFSLIGLIKTIGTIQIDRKRKETPENRLPFYSIVWHVNSSTLVWTLLNKTAKIFTLSKHKTKMCEWFRVKRWIVSCRTMCSVLRFSLSYSFSTSSTLRGDRVINSPDMTAQHIFIFAYFSSFYLLYQ